MVIDPNNIGSNTAASAKNRLAQGERASAPKGKEAPVGATASAADSVSISQEAKLLGALNAAVVDVPSVDIERVESIRNAIQSGNYQINPDAIAAKILDQDSSF